MSVLRKYITHYRRDDFIKKSKNTINVWLIPKYLLITFYTFVFIF